MFITQEMKCRPKIDNQLIRDYGDYFRGYFRTESRRIHHKSCSRDSERSIETETAVLTVLPHDRTGFAFYGERVQVPTADGTPKDGAVILYITENNKILCL